MTEIITNKTCWVLSYVYLDEANETVIFANKPSIEELAFHLLTLCEYYLKFNNSSDAIQVAIDLLNGSNCGFDRYLDLTEQRIY